MHPPAPPAARPEGEPPVEEREAVLAGID
jgi:hypothetical protein